MGTAVRISWPNWRLPRRRLGKQGTWLRLIRETQPHDQQELADLLKECEGLLNMLNSIILTTGRKFTSAVDSKPKARTQNSEPLGI